MVGPMPQGQEGFDVLKQHTIQPGLMSAGSYEYRIVEFEL